MPEARRRAGWALLAGFLLWSAYQYALLSAGTPICFDDCYTYLKLGPLPLGSQAYVDTLESMYRSWAVPVFFSLFGRLDGAAALRIVVAQSFLGFLAWVALAWACSRLHRGWGSVAAFVAVSTLMFSQGYLLLNHYLLSDSLGLSSVLLFAAWLLEAPALLGSAPVPGWRRAAYGLGFLVLGAVALGVRDASGLLVVLGLAALVPLAGQRLGPVPLLAMAGLLAGLVWKTLPYMRIRHQENMANVMAVIALPHPEARRYFVEHGMSGDLDRLGEALRRLPLDQVPKAEIDSRIPPIRALGADFLPGASGLYSRFLVTHPGFVASTAWRYREAIWGQSFGRDGVGGPSTSADPYVVQPGDQSLTILPEPRQLAPLDAVPLDARAALLLLLVPLVVVERSRRTLVPLGFALAGLLGGASAFLMDAGVRSEVSRHAWISAQLLNVGVTLTVVGALGVAGDRLGRARAVPVAVPAAEAGPPAGGG